MEKEVNAFFEKWIDPHRPILLGYSGGPDSVCLLHLLLSWKKIPLHLVHIDHGWRKESAQERKAIQELAQKLALPLHWIALDPKTMQGNLEAECRQKRLQFFQQVAREVQAQGCLLAHHADDQAETVFKRVLEGANLINLSGMAPIQKFDALTLLRPLLSIRKNQILAWLEQRGISSFHDATNADVRFLRAKMRQETFPFLRKSFGKAFEENLCQIAQEAQELRHYLDDQTASYCEKASCGPWGIFIPAFPESPIETKHLLQKLAKQQGIILSREQLQTAAHLLLTKAANKEIIHNARPIFVDRGRAFFCHHPLPPIESTITLTLGRMQIGNWNVTCQHYEGEQEFRNHFQDTWRGKLCTILPEGSYCLGRALPTYRRFTKAYRHFITDKKIPHFFTRWVPSIVQQETIVEDFLSGTTQLPDRPAFVVTLEAATHL